MHPRRRTAATALAVTAALALTLSACGDESGLKSAGPTPTAAGPVRLWPGLPAASTPPLQVGESDRRRVPGIEVAHGDVAALDPVAVVRADDAGRPADDYGIDGLPSATATALDHCGRNGQERGQVQGQGQGNEQGQGKPGEQGLGGLSACPVLKAYHRDLTGDGHDELIVGIRLPDHELSVRCYRAENGGLTRIMSTSDPITGVELAGRELILRVVAGDLPGYAYRTTWSWNAQRGTMLPTHDEIVPNPADGPDRTIPARHATAAPTRRETQRATHTTHTTRATPVTPAAPAPSVTP
ncbi:hypothetical protein AB0O07_14350 [Streptomyces sp. NPDC093085]|uniref:hypothetical protein n=1 Tax=Streptomyces sp. NPDC093085 TaxID=3155068 RepID=UPI0034150726